MENSPYPSIYVTENCARDLRDLEGKLPVTLAMKKGPRIRKMYLAAFCALLLAASKGLVGGYSAPATYDMAFRHNSSVKPNESEITWIGSIIALGSMFSGILAGTTADKIGRKYTLIIASVILDVGWLIIYYTRTVIIIIVGRFLSGFACGFIAAVVPMYCVEISTAEVRGSLGSSYQLFYVIGSLSSALIGSYVTWESLALNSAVFTTLAATCFCFMPESPKWILAKGRLEQAIQVMDELQGDYVDAESECSSIYKDLQSQPKGLLSLEECKHPTVYKPALIAVALQFFQQASGTNSVFFYSSEIFEISKTFLDPKKATIILGVVQVLATFMSILIVDKAGRKILLILSGIFMSLSHIFLGIYYFIASTNANFQDSYGWISLASLIVFVFAYSAGFGPLPYLLSVEMVPLRARSTVGGLTTLSNGIFVFITAKTFHDTEYLIGNYGTFWLYSCLSLVAAVFVFFIVPEMKGKKLEEIEKIFYEKEETKQVTSNV